MILDKFSEYYSVEANQMLAEDVWEISFHNYGEKDIKAGRFINLYLNDKAMLLPRPISICRYREGKLTLIYKPVGKGTKILTTYPAGTRVRLSRPLGNGYDIHNCLPGKQSALIIGGGMGIPPLLELAYALKNAGWIVNAALGYRNTPFLSEEFEQAADSVYMATEDGSHGFHGDIVTMIKSMGLKADAYFACGPEAMLKAITEHCKSIGKDIQVSLEERMGCGYGSCLGCVCNIESEDRGFEQKRVCKDGPVFSGREVIWSE